MSTAIFTNVSDMAEFCAVLVTKGIVFTVFDKGGSYVVEMTGF
jgi:hypothetical protein